MSELSERQKLILSLVVHEYVRTANPVGSKTLVKQYHLDYSSATVRNDLAALTEAQFLSQPYTSAGRVPTEKGYRFFVSGLAVVVGEFHMGAGIHDLDKGVAEAPVPVALELQVGGETGQVQILRVKEPLVIGPGHHDIDIVIPGNKTVVTDRTQQVPTAQ